MPSYAPLNNEDSPAIPSLDALRSNAVPSVEMPQVIQVSEKSEKSDEPMMLESYVVTASATPAPVRANDKYTVSSCCCGCSLATGVNLIAFVEAISYIFALFAAVFAIYIKTQENKIDHAIVKHDEAEDQEESTEGEASEDEMTTDEKIDQVNHIIDIAAYNSPFLILFSLIGLFFCYKGYKASLGDVNAARLYYKWKKFAIFWAFVQMIFGGGFGGFIGLLVAIYFCIVVRSHYLALSAEVAEPVDSVIVTTISEVRPSMA